MPTGYQNLTLSDLESQLAERYNHRPFWTEPAARRAINESLRIYNVLTGRWHLRTPVLTSPADPYVALQGSTVKPLRVLNGTTPLAQTSEVALDHRFPNWEGVAGTPTYWAPITLTTIAIYPVPASQMTLTIDVYAPAPIFPAGSTIALNLGSEELSTLLGYAFHVLSQSQGEAALKATLPQYQAMLQAGALVNTHLAASSFYRKVMGLDRSRYLAPAARPNEAAPAPPAGVPS